MTITNFSIKRGKRKSYFSSYRTVSSFYPLRSGVLVFMGALLVLLFTLRSLLGRGLANPVFNLIHCYPWLALY